MKLHALAHLPLACLLMGSFPLTSRSAIFHQCTSSCNHEQAHTHVCTSGCSHGSHPDSLLAPGTPTSGDFVLGPTTPGTWGAGATVTYSFADADGYSTSESPSGGTVFGLDAYMPVGWDDEIRAAFDAWEAVIDLTFVEVADSDTAWNSGGASGDIRIGGHVFDGAGGTLAHGYYPPNNGVSTAGDIHFDIAENWVIGFPGGGFDIFQVAAHEIGHAIGLAHTSVPNSLMNPFYSEAFSGPQADDIAGGVAVYGNAGGGGFYVPEPSTAMMVLFGGLLLRVRLRLSRNFRDPEWT